MVVVVGGGERVFCALFNTEIDSALAAFACTSAPRRTPGLEAPDLATGGEGETGRQRGVCLFINIRAYHRSGFAKGFGVPLGLPDPRKLENDHLAGVRRSSRQAPSLRSPDFKLRRALGASEPRAHGSGGVERGGGGRKVGRDGGEAVRPPFLGGEARVPGSPRALLSLIRPVQPGTGVASRAWRDASKPLGAVAAAGRRPSE